MSYFARVAQEPKAFPALYVNVDMFCEVALFDHMNCEYPFFEVVGIDKEGKEYALEKYFLKDFSDRENPEMRAKKAAFDFLNDLIEQINR